MADKIKQVQKSKKRCILIVAIAVSAVLIAAGVIFVLAYFTDNVHVGTTFTFGNVEIIPHEPDYPPDDPPDVPNEETPKNPMIANNGSEACIVFMEVKVPVAAFTLVSEDGKTAEAVVTEVFFLKTEDGEDGNDSFHDTEHGGNWVLLSHTPGETDGEYTTWLFGYRLPLDGTDERVENVLDPSEEELAKLQRTEALFDKVQIKNYLEGTLNGGYSIIVNSYGVQANYLTDGSGNYIFGEDGVPETGEALSYETLQTIWDIYSEKMA